MELCGTTSSEWVLVSSRPQWCTADASVCYAHRDSPFGVHSDDVIVDALEKAHLRSNMLGAPFTLDQEVAENGENLSVGERQLMVSAGCTRNSTMSLHCVSARLTPPPAPRRTVCASAWPERCFASRSCWSSTKQPRQVRCPIAAWSRLVVEYLLTPPPLPSAAAVLQWTPKRTHSCKPLCGSTSQVQPCLRLRTGSRPSW